MLTGFADRELEIYRATPSASAADRLQQHPVAESQQPQQQRLAVPLGYIFGSKCTYDISLDRSNLLAATPHVQGFGSRDPLSTKPTNLQKQHPCIKCNKHTHLSRHCSGPGEPISGMLRACVCCDWTEGEQGHLVDECPALRRADRTYTDFCRELFRFVYTQRIGKIQVAPRENHSWPELTRYAGQPFNINSVTKADRPLTI